MSTVREVGNSGPGVGTTSMARQVGSGDGTSSSSSSSSSSRDGTATVTTCFGSVLSLPASLAKYDAMS